MKPKYETAEELYQDIKNHLIKDGYISDKSKETLSVTDFADKCRECGNFGLVKQSDASVEMFNKGDNKKSFIDVYNYLARHDYEKIILNFENGASITVEIHEPAVRINLSDIEEGESK